MAVRTTYKDSLFRHLFGDERRKGNALQLYNALAGTSYTDPDAIELTTIGDAVFLGRKNDVSFLVGDEMVLWEHQSTHNPNMPLRGLQYFDRLYTKLIELDETMDIYGRTPLSLPTPRFVVFYFGEAARPDREQLRLSDLFSAGPGDVEVTATVFNCNEGRNAAIMEACEALRGYAHLLALVRRNLRTGNMELEDAVSAAIDECIREGILADYLAEHRAEVKDMLWTIQDEERAMRVHWNAVEREAREEGWKAGHEEGWKAGQEEGWKAGQEEGWKAGQEEGRQEALNDMARKLRELGIDEELIAEAMAEHENK